MGKKLIKGIYSQSSTGSFGFVDVEGIDKGFYVYDLNKADAMDKDEVLAEVKVFKGKEEAVIIEVTKRSEKILVGELHLVKGKKFGFVVLKDNTYKNDVFISPKSIFKSKARDKDIVGIKIKKWSGNKPEGVIVDILNKDSKYDINVNSYIMESGFKSHPPAPSLLGRESKIKSPLPVREGLGVGRKDLKNLFTFTIDGEDAKDLDDAISIDFKAPDKGLGFFILYVHIADVAQYVKENSSLDKEALKRGTSVYLTDRVIPMLPEKLSNDLCSLNPDTDKLTMTCEMHISQDGNVFKTKVYESLIKSDVRLSYKEVDEILSPEGGKYPRNEGDWGIKVKKSLNLAQSLKNIILKNREKNGVLNFEFPETKVILDKNNKVVEIKQYERYDSNKMIEAFMVIANESISKYFADIPFLNRIHPEPSDIDLSTLQDTLNLFGIDFKFKKYNTKEFSKLLLKIDENPKKRSLEKIILRTLSKAIYSHDESGHFGLGLKFYSHFTSPIRRYPDLQIHRIIKEKINGKLSPDRIHHYKNILKDVANQCSEQERKAEKLEYKIRDYFITHFYKDKVGDTFEATISGIIPKGFFVELDNTAEGFVSTAKNIGNFVYEEEFMRFRNLDSGTVYAIGDKVKVELFEVDEDNLRLNFAII